MNNSKIQFIFKIIIAILVFSSYVLENYLLTFGSVVLFIIVEWVLLWLRSLLNVSLSQREVKVNNSLNVLVALAFIGGIIYSYGNKNWIFNLMGALLFLSFSRSLLDIINTKKTSGE